MQGLTEKELLVARLAAMGMTAKMSADEMSLSPETIRWYRKRMLLKTGARNMAELIAMLKDKHII